MTAVSNKPESEWLKVYSRVGHYPKAWENKIIQKIMRASVTGCEICGLAKEQGLMDVHHLRHLDKHDCRWENLIVVCRPCHSKLHRWDYHPDRQWKQEWGEFPEALRVRGISPNSSTTNNNTMTNDALTKAVHKLLSMLPPNTTTLNTTYKQQSFTITITPCTT